MAARTGSRRRKNEGRTGSRQLKNEGGAEGGVGGDDGHGPYGDVVDDRICSAFPHLSLWDKSHEGVLPSSRPETGSHRHTECWQTADGPSCSLILINEQEGCQSRQLAR